MAESKRRLPSWMTGAGGGDADDEQPLPKPDRKSNGNARKKTKANPNDDEQQPIRKSARMKPKANRNETAASPGGNDVDRGGAQILTVQDLVAIAEEYIRAADEVGSEANLSVKGECAGILLHGGVTVHKHNSSTNSTAATKEIPSITTEDAAHDMLHLFLGPLLTKPSS